MKTKSNKPLVKKTFRSLLNHPSTDKYKPDRSSFSDVIDNILSIMDAISQQPYLPNREEFRRQALFLYMYDGEIDIQERIRSLFER